MKRTEFEDVYELAENMSSIMELINDTYPIISVYGNYDVIKNLLTALILDGYEVGGSIELEDYECSHYDKEFILYLCDDGVTVEKLYHSDDKYNKAGYYKSAADVAFVHEECNSKLLSSISSPVIIEFGFINDDNGDESDCETECHNCDAAQSNNMKENDRNKPCVEYSKDEDGNMHGFTASRSDGNSYYSYSVYTTNNLSQKDIQALLQEVGF